MKYSKLLKARGFGVVKSSFPLYKKPDPNKENDWIIPNKHLSECLCVGCGKIFEAWFEDVYAPLETRICRECHFESQRLQIAYNYLFEKSRGN